MSSCVVLVVIGVMVLVDGWIVAVVVSLLVLVAAEVKVALEVRMLVLGVAAVGVFDDTVSDSTVVSLVCSVKIGS